MKPKGVPEHYVEIYRDCWVHPSLVKERSAVGGLLPAQPKQDPLPALDHQPKERRRRTQRVAVRITFIRVGKALLDDDNLASCFKGSRDAIAKALGIDDRDPRVKWHYAQVTTQGRVGHIVNIELV